MQEREVGRRRACEREEGTRQGILGMQEGVQSLAQVSVNPGSLQVRTPSREAGTRWGLDRYRGRRAGALVLTGASRAAFPPAAAAVAAFVY